MEPHTWEILHQLYALAEFQRLADLPVPEPLSGASTIKGTYAQALVLSCCKPNQLRQGELGSLYRGLQQWAALVEIESRESGSELFLVDLESDQPAQNRALYRDHLTAACRAINTNKFLEHIKVLSEKVIEQGTNFDKKTGVSFALLDHLVTSLGSASLRNFKRTASNSPLWICVGLGSTHYQVARQQLKDKMQGGGRYVPAPVGAAADSNPFLSQGDNSSGKNRGIHFNEDGELKNEPEDEVDVDATTRAMVLPEEQFDMPARERHPVFEVQLANTSANGYCLEWVDDVSAEIRSGDIVGLKEDKEQNEWSIAVIRWLSRLRNAKTLVGLELLSPRGVAYSGSIHRSGGEEASTPVRVLLLPEIKIVGQPNTLITPRTGFKGKTEGDIAQQPGDTPGATAATDLLNSGL